MKPIKHVFRQTLSLVFVLALSVAVHAAQGWEYLYKKYPIVGDHKAITRMLNKLGKDAWELVSCVESSGYMSCIFKRPLEERHHENP